MSISKVTTGAPWTMAAKPPTSMNSTSWWDRTFRIWMNLGAESIAEHHDAVDEILCHLDTLGRSEAEHPENDVVIVPFPDVWLQSLGLGAWDRFVDRMEGISR